MKLYINGCLVETSPSDSVILVFKDDEERVTIGTHLLENFTQKDGPRKYGMFPEEMSEEECRHHMALVDIPEEEQEEVREYAWKLARATERKKHAIEYLEKMRKDGGVPPVPGITVAEADLIYYEPNQFGVIAIVPRDKEESIALMGELTSFLDAWEERYDEINGERVLTEPCGWWNEVPDFPLDPSAKMLGKTLDGLNELSASLQK